jgi:outer membrane protein OmpA-like peptidoglycan-associated protein
MHSPIRATVPVAILSLVAAGCGGLPDRVDSVEQARESIAEISREPLAGRVAGQELQAARDALASADEAYDEGEPIQLIEHQAYVAQRYADISRELVSEAQAREEVERGEAERNRIIAEARAREAQAAQREAQAAQLAVAEQSQVADAAQARARNLERELEDLQAEETDRGLVLTLGDVLFETGQATLMAGALTTVDRLAQFMGDYPERTIQIEGHTDSVGSDTLNQQLSEQRAAAVRDALVARGVDTGRIQTIGYGEARPVASNDTSGGRQQNRRIEIVVSGDQAGAADTASR